MGEAQESQHADVHEPIRNKAFDANKRFPPVTGEKLLRSHLGIELQLEAKKKVLSSRYQLAQLAQKAASLPEAKTPEAVDVNKPLTEDVQVENLAATASSGGGDVPILPIIICASAVLVIGIAIIGFIYSKNMRGGSYRDDIVEPHVTRSLPRVDYSKKPTKPTPGSLQKH